MRLRSFGDGDLPAMHALDRTCFRTGIAFSMEVLDFYAHHPAVLTILAEGDDNLAGFAMAEVRRAHKQASGHVITIDVHPDWRRRGVGRLLMTAIEDWLRGQKVTVCSLEVAADEPGSLSFYGELAYVVAGKIPGYYDGMADALILRKALDPGNKDSCECPVSKL